MKIRDLIINKSDIAEYIGQYATLIHQSKGLRGKCPIHNGDRNDTLMVVPETNSYYCFACGSGGSIINFVSDIENISYHAAIEKLALSLNIDSGTHAEFNEAKNIVNKNEHFASNSKKYIPHVKEYLINNRGLSEEIIDEFDLGYNDGLIIPIRDEHGRTVAIAKRQFDKNPKYLNSKNNAIYDKSELLFNMDKAKRIIKKEVYLVEGYMDAISGHQMGLPTMAFCSNSITRFQINKIDNFIKHDVSIIYCADNDDAGLGKMYKVREMFNRMTPNRNVRILVMPQGYKDMNDLLVAGINPQMLDKEHIDTFVLKQLLANCANQEEEYLVVEQFIRTVKNPMIRIDLSDIVAKRWDKPKDQIRKQLDASIQTDEDMMTEFASVESCISDLKESITSGGFTLGFPRLDRSLRRVRKKQVIVVGAYSYSGKTDFAIETTLKAIIDNKMRVMFFSLEMPKGMIMERMIAKVLGIPTSEVENLVRNGDDTVIQVRMVLEKYLIVIDTNSLSVEDISKRIQFANARSVLGADVDMVIIDYFTYLKGTDTFDGASQSARRLKAIAKDHNIILVMLSQLNREGSNFDEPTMRNLRMTGDLESSADIILLLWRPGLNPKLTLEEANEKKFQTMIKLEKARDGIYGPTKFEYQYNKNTSRLEEM